MRIFRFLQGRIIDFRSSAGLRAVTSNVSWLLYDKVLRMGVGLIVGAWVARHLGPNDFGTYNYAIALTGLFAIFANLGLESVVVKELVSNPSHQRSLLGATFVLRLVAGVVAFVSCILLVFLLNHKDDPMLVSLTGIVALSLIIQSFDTVDLFFQSRVLSRYTVIARNSSFILFSAIKVYLILSKSGVTAFAWAYTLELAVASVLMIIAFRRFAPANELIAFHLSNVRPLLKQSWPLIFSGFVIILYMRTDQLVVKELLGNGAVGIYSVAVRISEVWYFIPSVLMTSIFPAIIRLRNRGVAEYYGKLQTLYTMMTWLAIGIAIVVTFLSRWIINVLFGPEYEDASTVLAVHIWTGVFVFQGTARGYWLLNEGLQVYGMAYTGAACLLNLLLNYLLLPRYGIDGAAYATLISYFCSVIAFPLFFKSTRMSSVQLLKSFLWKMK